jgi:hypothetical protein
MKNLQYFENFKLRLKESPHKLEELQKEFSEEVMDVMYHIVDEVDDYRVEWSLEESSPFWGRFYFKCDMDKLISVYKLICECCSIYNTSTDFKYEVSLMIINNDFGNPISNRNAPIFLRCNVPFDYNWTINQFMNNVLMGKGEKIRHDIVNLFQNWNKLPPWQKPELIWVFDVIAK